MTHLEPMNRVSLNGGDPTGNIWTLAGEGLPVCMKDSGAS